MAAHRAVKVCIYLDDNWRDGQTFTGDEPVYVRIKKANGKVKWLHYWFNYGQSFVNKCLGSWGVRTCKRFGYHEGDWEHMAVMLDGSEQPFMVRYYYHYEQCSLPWDLPMVPEVPRLGTQPLIDVAVNSHGSYPKGFEMEAIDWEPSGPVYTWNGARNLKVLPNVRGVADSPVPWYGYRGSFGESTDLPLQSPFLPRTSPTGPNPDREYTPGFQKGPICQRAS